MPAELQQNRYDQLLRRVGGVVGPGSKVAEVLPELFPTLDVENVPGELLALMQTVLAFGSAEAPGAAAQFATVQIFNPVASGKLITVSSAVLTTLLLGGYRWAVVNTAAPTLVATAAPRDTRFPTTGDIVGQIRTDSTAVAVTRQGQMYMIANAAITLTDPNGLAILAPGTGLSFQNTDVNEAIRVTYYWRERVAQQSELNF